MTACHRRDDDAAVTLLRPFLAGSALQEGGVVNEPTARLNASFSFVFAMTPTTSTT
jgi:hypothetical protein